MDPYYVADPYDRNPVPQQRAPIPGSDGYYDTPNASPALERSYEEFHSEQNVSPPSRENYPMAQKTSHPSRVISPYPPYNVIDVEGFRGGQLAKDPSNGKIFRVP